MTTLFKKTDFFQTCQTPVKLLPASFDFVICRFPTKLIATQLWTDEGVINVSCALLIYCKLICLINTYNDIMCCGNSFCVVQRIWSAWWINCFKITNFWKSGKIDKFRNDDDFKAFFFFQNSILSAFRQVIAVVPASVETILSVFYFSRVKLIAVQWWTDKGAIYILK